MNGYVYSIKSPSNKRYIGITKRNPKNRYQEHVRHSLNRRLNRKLYKAFRRYGKEFMELEILEVIESDCEFDLMNKLHELEVAYIERYDSFYNGYNGTVGGEGTVGMTGELNAFYGKKHDPETLRRLSELGRLRTHSEETKRKISESGKGVLHTEKSKVKMKEYWTERKGKRVICLDDGEVFDSITLCAEHYNVSRSDIRKVCEGKRITAHGKRFRFMEGDNVVKVEEPLNKRVRSVQCLENGKVYESIQACCDDLGVRHQHVSAILRGRQKTTKGYSFIYY